VKPGNVAMMAKRNYKLHTSYIQDTYTYAQ